MSTPTPPRLPPRRPIPQPPLATDTNEAPIQHISSSPTAILTSRPVPASVGSTSIDLSSLPSREHVPQIKQKTSIGSSSIILPPPLPPRIPSVSRPVPEPILVNEGKSRVISSEFSNRPLAIPIHEPANENEESQPNTALQPPDTSVTVAITPATPPDSENGSSPTSPTAPSFGQSVEEMQTPLPISESPLTHHFQQEPITPIPISPQPSTTTPYSESVESPVPPPLPPRKANPPPLPPRRSRSTNVALSTVPSVAPMVWMVSMILLAYMRVSFASLVILGLLGYIGMKRLEETSEKILKEQEPEDVRPSVKGNVEAVEWLNHALYALFPLISTDVLTPFVDLMEDALAEQVPPVVTSVRLTSPALGSQPVLLTSLKPLSDEEWFSSLSIPNQRSENSMRKSDLKRNIKSPSSNKGTHQRTTSNLSLKSPSKNGESSKMSRSISGSSLGSGKSSDEMAKEAIKRRKRDRILQKVSRKRPPMENDNKIKGQHEENPNPSHMDESIDSTQNEQGVKEQETNGSRKHGGEDDESELDEDDPNAGQYVNYQVGFEYKRSKDAEKKGRGLHCLAYFGWGIKGVAKSEIPVYIDVISIKGTVNLRLLLSATPPFIRTGTFSFPTLPEYDVSAHPLKKGAFNAMELPGMKQYVKQSITEVASAFVSPESYTLDLDRLLLGSESSLRTHNIGVLHIIIHSAEDLPKVDTMGSCDPYISIGMSKYHKPLFSTRTIRDSRDPKWDEEAFILVSSDAIESGENLRLRACDSDRFSADDAMGVVEVELSSLVDTHSDKLYHRRDSFKEDRPGMKCSGLLNWSIQFHGLWQMSNEEVKNRILKSKENDKSREEFNPPSYGSGQGENQVPYWMELLSKIIDKNDEKWYIERDKKRKETKAWFMGEKQRDELEVQGKPDEGLKSGILQFHIHQCIDLEVEPLSGTYSSHTSSNKSPAGGKPALESLTERTPTENPEPPSSYCEVHLNDKLIYKTRTKQVTPLPYFNAVSERFVRDWTKSKITFVVRDERNREHDPILGLVVIPLKEAFRSRSQFTRWFPLVGGLGWGRVRISLLWKPLDMSLPRGFSGYEVATLRLKTLSFNSLGIGLPSEKGFSVLLATDSDKYELDTSPDDISATPTSARTSLERIRSPSRTSLDGGEEIELEFDLTSKHIRLAIMYRHSCSLLITLISRSSVLKKKKIMGMGVVKLSNMIDGNGSAKIAIWGTEDVEKVMRSQEMLDYEESGLDGDGGDHGDDVDSRYLMSPPLNSSRKPSFRRRISSRKSWPNNNNGNSTPTRQRAISTSSSRSSISIPSSTHSISGNINKETPLLGYANLEFKLIPGVSKIHRKISKRDLRFNKVFEVWEIENEIKMGWDKMNQGERLKDELENVKDHLKNDGDDSDQDDITPEDDEDEIKSSSDEYDSDDEERGKEDKAKNNLTDSEDGSDHLRSERKAHSHALHKRHKGIFQLKIARTGRYVKDKLSAKVYSAAHSGGNKDEGRSRGTDLEVEREGISKM